MGFFLHKLKKIFSSADSSQRELEYRLSRGLIIGDNTHIYSIEGIDGAWPWLIRIGNNVTISSDVTILAHDASTNVVRCSTKLGRVVIGDNVFIGARSIVLCNTKIGDNVIGSVCFAGFRYDPKALVRNLPSNAVYAGSPAKYICSIEEYREKYTKLYQVRPHFDQIRPWDEWTSATEEERKEMLKGLEDGIGFV